MLNGVDQVIILFRNEVLHLLPYGNLTIEGFAVGELAWIIAIVTILGEIYLMLYKKKVVK
jgi:hypothetical protein